MKESVAIGGGLCALIIALLALWWVVGGLVLSLVWNALLPYLAGAPTIEWWQGSLILILLSLIGGALKSGGSN